MPFDYTSLFRPDLPAGKPRWTGFPDYSFVGGHNDEASVPIDGLIRAAERVLGREGPGLARYGLYSGPQGYRPLREFLVRSLGQRTGMRITPDEVLIVSGSLQALDLVNDMLLARGDTVIVEESTYQGTLQRLDRLGVRYLGVPLDEGGIRIDALGDLLAKLKAEGTRPKYIYTIPTIQNPTGTVMTEARRRALVALAREYGVPVFEDECYADLTFDGARPPAIHACDSDGQVIFCGSFSKTIAPALRVGYVVAPWDVISRLLAVKYDGGSGALEQMVLAEYCAAHFDEHVTALRGTFEKKCDAIMEALAAEFGTAAEFSRPAGGIYIWVKLPEAVDTMRLYEAALAEGVAINPGPEWSVDPEAGRHSLRLCYGHPTEEEIRHGVARLADICHREFGLPERSANVGRG